MFQQGQPAVMFFTDDVKGDYERIKARGAEFTMPPTEVTGSTIAKLNDTCGNLIQISSWRAGRAERAAQRRKKPGESGGAMNEASTEALSVVVEREMPFPPEKIWRALTQPHLIEEWLMKNDFMPVVGRRFVFEGRLANLNIVVDCEVLAVEPNRTLTYTWTAYGLESVVTWT